MNIYDRPRVIYRDDSGKLVVGNYSIIQIQFSAVGISVTLWKTNKKDERPLRFEHWEIGYNLFLDNFILEITDINGNKVDLHDNDIVRVHMDIEEAVPGEKDYTDHLVIWIGDCSSNPCFDLLPHPDGIDYNGIEWMIDSVDVRGVEIIGNKHQNPELVPEAALKALEALET